VLCAYIYISGGPFSKKVAVCGVVWVAKQKELLLLVPAAADADAAAAVGGWSGERLCGSGNRLRQQR
jgi:hypothetical protein